MLCIFHTNKFLVKKKLSPCYSFLIYFFLINVDNEDFKHRQLTQNFREAVQNEIEATEERVRLYSEQQFTMLQTFRNKAEQDYNYLTRFAINTISL